MKTDWILNTDQLKEISMGDVGKTLSGHIVCDTMNGNSAKIMYSRSLKKLVVCIEDNQKYTNGYGSLKYYVVDPSYPISQTTTRIMGRNNFSERLNRCFGTDKDFAVPIAAIAKGAMYAAQIWEALPDDLKKNILEYTKKKAPDVIGALAGLFDSANK